MGPLVAGDDARNDVTNNGFEHRQVPPERNQPTTAQLTGSLDPARPPTINHKSL